MPNYRRALAPGGTFFFTIVTFRRRDIFSDPLCVDQLRRTVRAEQAQHPFSIEAAVILPDHLHMIWQMPEGDSDYSSRIGRIKANFTKTGVVERSAPCASGTKSSGKYADIWQPRFWEHRIRDEGDLERHLHYIHYNPVKHGHCRCPHGWPYSSFRKWVSSGAYATDWCCNCDGSTVSAPDFSSISPESE